MIGSTLEPLPILHIKYNICVFKPDKLQIKVIKQELTEKIVYFTV